MKTTPVVVRMLGPPQILMLKPDHQCDSANEVVIS